MEIYLFRHGIAEEKRAELPDEDRKLTQEGQQKTEKVAQYLKKLDFRFDLILTSPLVRAKHTAEILMQAGLSQKVEESAYLAPDGEISEWLINWLEPKKYSSKIKLVLVGHEPDLGHWAEILVYGEAKGRLVLKKAGMIGIKAPETGSLLGHSDMFWLTPPRYLI
ncbi:phosphohistidine phosphatase SixA [Calothrix sp. PCC 6303]|uniref:phosphohistidine phosphatase SixA n=1 Tax=Calothrix sp. PCC 6303 TaxID=1170562 RepID=UPI0002A04A69|nr:phosphohistidine phosphatase SixA [Calothrix sp. PCC 6303]AFZ03534.1 phosphohistidine phosphatase, SixA [Calothrix sp. PCC 6303]